MKRLFSILIASLFFATSVLGTVSTVDINSYASQLSVVNNGVVDASRQVSVKFAVMAPTKSYKVYVDLNKNGSFGDSGDYTYSYTGAEIANNTIVTATFTIPGNVSIGEYKWAVEVEGSKTDIGGNTLRVARNYENKDNRYRFTKALDVVVDNSYESDYFGYSYVSESYTHDLYLPSTPDAGELNKTATTDGIYMFKPNMGTVWNTNAAGTALVNNGAYTGGINWTKDDQASHAQDQREHGPYRMAMDEDGYVYVCENRPASDGGQLVYRMNPHNPTSDFKVVLDRSVFDPYSELAKRVQSIAVATVNGKKVLYVISSHVTTSSDSGTAVYVGENLMSKASRLCSFTINEDGDNVTVTYNNDATPLYDIPCASPNQNLAVVNTYNSMVAGVHGDLWIFQYIGSNHSKYAGTLHLYKEGNTWKCDKAIPATEYYNVRGVGAINKDGSILAIPVADFGVKFFDITYTADGKLQSYTAKNWALPAKRSASATSGTGIWDQAVGTSSVSAPNTIDGLAFDVANNLYIIAGDGDLRLSNANYTRSRLYVYACPISENKHLTPARSSQTIKISDAICWHPYPDSYSMTNEDLQAMFKRDFAASHSGADYTTLTTDGGELQTYMTSTNSPWKWLGDYLLARGAQRQDVSLPSDMDSNEKLWGSNEGAISDGFKKYYNDKYVAAGHSSRSNMSIKDVATFLVSSDFTKQVLSESGSKYRWLYDYLLSVASSQGKTITQYWNYVLHGFFNKVTDGYVTNSQGSKIYYNIDFSSAGDPSAWGPAYLASTLRDLTSSEIDKNSEWQRLLEAFFGCKQITTANGFITPDYSTDGQPSAWYSLWLASLPATPEAVKANGFPVPVRKDHVFAGWYYGTKCETGTKAYDINSPVNTTNIAYACVYARWIEACLHEGEVIDPQMLKEQQAQYRNFNIDLINLLAGQNVALKIDRKLVGGMYNTMCLPFAIAGKEDFAKITYADGSGTPFAKAGGEYPFSLVRYVGTVAGDDALMLDFEELGDTDELPANTPFLLMPNNDITKLMQYGSAPLISDEGSNALGQNYGLTIGDEDNYFTYTGVLAPAVIPDGSVLLVADNRLAQSTGGEMKGMRGFFTAKIEPQQKLMVVRITSRDGVTTYLDAATTSNTSKIATKILRNGHIYILRDGKTYSITGARVE